MVSFLRKETLTLATLCLIQVGMGQDWSISEVEDHWPQGELNCAHGYRWFDPLLQKKTYYVGVHAPAGIETAWREFNLTFEEYLDRTVGDRFIPPINFKKVGIISFDFFF